MEFSKRKYIIFKQEFPNNVPLNSVYIGYTYKRISDWGMVKMQHCHISEIVEYDELYCYIPDFQFDEFNRFSTGRRALLVEKYSKRNINKSILVERGERVDRVYVPVKIKAEKVIMSNGNSYITLP